MLKRTKNFLLIAGLAILSCGMTACSASTPRAPEEPRTGVYVSGDHYKMQWILYFTEGLTVAYGQGETSQRKVIPWRDVEFIELEPGKHDFDLYFQYGGKAGKVQACVRLNEGDLVHLKYDAPFIVLNDGDIEVLDVKTGESLPHNEYCPN